MWRVWEWKRDKHIRKQSKGENEMYVGIAFAQW